MAATMVQVCEPADALDADVLDAIFVDAPTRRVQRIVVRNAELAVAAVDGDAQPQLVVLDERKDLLVGDRVWTFPMIRNFFPCSTSWATYSRKREKGGLVTTMSACFQERDALGAAEVAAGVLVVALSRLSGRPCSA